VRDGYGDPERSSHHANMWQRVAKVVLAYRDVEDGNTKKEVSA
jgi:hypothetical protein